MKMKWILIGLLILGVIAIVGVGVFFIWLYNKDVSAISGFLAAYSRYDQAFSEYSTNGLGPGSSGSTTAPELDQKAGAALDELDGRGSARISSLMKYDKELMMSFKEITELSGKELVALRAYRIAADKKSADLPPLAQQIQELTRQRKSSFARLEELLR